MILKYNILNKFFFNIKNLLLGLLGVDSVINTLLLGVDQVSILNDN